MHTGMPGRKWAVVPMLIFGIGCKSIPKAPGFDPDSNVGQSGRHDVREFVRRSLNKGFAEPQEFYLRSKDTTSDDCKLFISVAKNSVNIKKKVENRARHGFILALITTSDPNCHPEQFEMAKNDTVAWFVRYDNPDVLGQPDTPQGAEGRSGLVLMPADTTQADKWFENKRYLKLGYCNHDRNDPTDQALVLAPDSVCNFVSNNGHDARRVSEVLKRGRDKSPGNLFRKYVPSGDNVSLWFACGGDCCYGTFASR